MTVENVKYTDDVTLTTTGLTTTFNNGDVWESDAIDNNAASTQWLDIQIGGQFAVSTGTPTRGYNVYATGSIDGAGARFGGNATGSEGVTTTLFLPNMKLIGHVATPTASTTYEFGPFGVAWVFGGFLPDQVVIVVESVSNMDMTTAVNQIIAYMPIERELT